MLQQTASAQSHASWPQDAPQRARVLTLTCPFRLRADSDIESLSPGIGSFKPPRTKALGDLVRLTPDTCDQTWSAPECRAAPDRWAFVVLCRCCATCPRSQKDVLNVRPMTGRVQLLDRQLKPLTMPTSAFGVHSATPDRIESPRKAATLALLLFVMHPDAELQLRSRHSPLRACFRVLTQGYHGQINTIRRRGVSRGAKRRE